MTFKLHALIDFFFIQFFIFLLLFVTIYFFSGADFSNIHWLQPHQPCLIYRVLIIVRTMKTNQVQQPYQQSQRPQRMWASVRSVHRIKSIKFIIQMVAHRLYTNITKCRIKIIFNGRKYLFQCISWWVSFSFDEATSYINFPIEWKWYNACIKCWYLYYFHLNVMFAPDFHCVLQKLHFKPQFHSIVWRTPISIALNKHNEREKKKHSLTFFVNFPTIWCCNRNMKLPSIDTSKKSN